MQPRQKNASKQRKTTDLTGKYRYQWPLPYELIEAAPLDFESPVILKSIALPYEKRRVEAVGEFYEKLMHRYWYKLSDIKMLGDQSDIALNLEDDCSDDNLDRVLGQLSRFDPDSINLNKLSEPIDDLYAMLGLGHLRWMATPHEIRQGYRHAALTYHPDKMESKDDKMFKAINKAWNQLGNPTSRIEYDSLDPFDDTLPDPLALTSLDKIYSVFSSTFRLNSKWSKIQPVPEFGGATMSIEKVQDFYNFWLEFQSWRTFSELNEHNLLEAESRDERRWMELQNVKSQQPKIKEERKRIRKLVMMAYELDPRIKAMHLREKKEKQMRKRQAHSKARYGSDSHNGSNSYQMGTTTNELGSTASEGSNTVEMQPSLEALKETILQFGRQKTNVINFSHILAIVQRADIEQLKEIVQSLKNLAEAKEKIISCYHSLSPAQANGVVATKTPSSNVTVSTAIKTSDTWTTQESTLLVKALARYPGGAINRWQQIAAFLNYRKTEEQIIARVKGVKANTNRKNTNDTTTTLNAKANIDDQPSTMANHTVPTANGVPGTNVEERAMKSNSIDSFPSHTANWTRDQQIRLENALKNYPASVANRWDLIAEQVPSKNREECVQRFKYLVNLVKKKATQ